MTEAKKILGLIEGLSKDRLEDTGAPRKLNKALALYLGWYYFTPSEAKSKWGKGFRKGAWIHPSDCRDGEPVFCQMHGTDVYRDIPNFVQSLDAIKAVEDAELKGWIFLTDCVDMEGLREGFTQRYCAYKDGGKDSKEWLASIYSKFLPTEYLARLHAVVQAIEWKRENND